MKVIKAISLGFLILASSTGLSACLKSNTISGAIELPIQFEDKIMPTAALYVFARHPKEKAGPPLAAKRFTQPLRFPMQYELSTEDALIPNTPLQGELELVARISQSGSATPIEPGDIQGAAPANPVRVGSKDIKIVLDQMQ